jgi:Ca2+/Na+ antiporter
MPVSSFIFMISLLVLIVSARFFTTAAENLGLHSGMSTFVIGVFIVGIGASLPELAAGVLACFSLPVFVAAAILFYLLTQDKKISPSEGMLFLVFYGFFISRAVVAFI